MKEYFFKRALPFILTFAVGAAVGGFFQLFHTRDGGWFKKRYSYSYRSRRGCDKKFRRQFAAAPELQRPVITFKPDARIPPGLDRSRLMYGVRDVRVSVTFGADNRVHEVRAVDRHSPELIEAAERAARFVQFIPANLNGSPITFTDEVEIRFSFE